MREYFWHILIAFGLLVLLSFGAIALSLRFSNDIRYTDTITVTTPAITIADPQYGGSDAPVTLVTYSDYSCGGCANLSKAVFALLEKYPQKIRLVWKDMPNEARNAEAMPSALAARCAGKQGKFWEYHTLLFANHDRLGNEVYQSIANEVGLDASTFLTCMEREDTRPLVERTLSEGLALEITATPTVFINGSRFTGNLSQSELEKALLSALK